MIIKSFEIQKKTLDKINFHLLYGENEGFKEEIIKKNFEAEYEGNITRYDEKEILENNENFLNSIFSKSFFDDKKMIIISRSSDKILETIKEILEKKIEDTKIIITAGVLEKKSKLRCFFEKEKNTICIPFYSDNQQILGTIATRFFNEKKILISREIINLIVDRSSGDRKNLKNELSKIESFLKGKKKVEIKDIEYLTNLAENHEISELIDQCLAKNQRKTINILNENNFSLDDCVMIIRIFLNKLKRLYKIHLEIQNDKNLEQVITSFKPPIFWKDKEIVKKQFKSWSYKNVENLIYETNEIELLIKKNSINSINILSDFIITKSKISNN